MQKIVDGIRFGYDSAGSGQTLVMLHGFLLDRSIWDAQFAALSPRCRVIRIDLRGSGESAAAAGPALVETLAGDVFGLLEALDVGRAIVAGHSLGGYVALAFFRMYAERVAGLGLIAAGVGAATPQQRRTGEELLAAIEARGIGAAVAACVPPGLDAALRDRVHALMARQPERGAVAQLIGMQERLGSEDLLEDIGVPVTIVCGERDPSISAGEPERTAAAIADCELVRVAGSAGLPMLEAPGATTAALERLLARCAISPLTASQTGRANRA